MRTRDGLTAGTLSGVPASLSSEPSGLAAKEELAVPANARPQSIFRMIHEGIPLIAGEPYMRYCHSCRLIVSLVFLPLELFYASSARWICVLLMGLGIRNSNCRNNRWH